MTAPAQITIRQATTADFPFIEKMCYLSSYPFNETDDPTFEAAKQLKWFQVYTTDWPSHDGDYGVIAEDLSGNSVGAAWYRIYVREELGPDVPQHELSIAVIPEMQGQHIGQRLLEALISGAAEHGVKQLILQVKDNNARAKELYQSVGFTQITHTKHGYDVMIINTQTV